MGTEINKIVNKKNREESMKLKKCFFEKINKIDRSLARLTKTIREDKISKVRNERRDITTNPTEIINRL